MVKGYILINTRPGKEYDVANQLKTFPFVNDVDITYGLWDIIIKIQAPSLAELDKIISMVRGLKDVEQTVTLVAHE
ncbi:Lrp/AsnC ligand binding domain-containing protein [Thermofilum pendens]|uniref:Transcriptional regulator, AsnC family n=1 Tax=Thermofilum pendens (strain DSM 2475 / Hrk 5) TaxID=368408 RepID=A1RXZ0_THEPD|nr:Lrp/AsnC ligand binding domain-containing protein [Thermofilum pendens]ABL78070.1 putative transcriptional regulator, AsnC family [Thermofilum pendens Hrk 5]